MRIVIMVFISLLILIACNSDDNANAFTLTIAGCDVENPLEELDWLKAEIERREQNQSEEMKYCYIVQASYQGQTIFIYEDCNPLVDKAPSLIDCTGSIIGSAGETNFTNNQFTNRNIIYKPSDFSCSL